jgi:hypothetical protein
MKAALIALLALTSVAACGGQTTPAAKSPAAASTTSEGATSQQGKDEASRPLNGEECKELGQSITDACHGTNTRSAQFEGWCGDVIHGIDAGSWLSDCEHHIKYMDAVCFTSNTSIRAMMDCDRAVSR